MVSILKLLDGRKTYTIAAAMIVWSVVGWRLGWLNPVSAQGMVLQALGLAGLRNALPA